MSFLAANSSPSNLDPKGRGKRNLAIIGVVAIAALLLFMFCNISFGQKTFTDTRDGRKYKTVKIGTQTWMAENLNYDASGSKCYGDYLANCQKYGRLYDWEAAMKACSNGWHLPTKAEWEVLTATVGGEETEGKYLKAKSDWANDVEGKSGNGTDKYGFSALPGGRYLYYYDFGGFDDAGLSGLWWSASEASSDYAYYRGIYYSLESTYWDYSDKSYGFSVRCLQD
jgi:uncharacterized protein (TIGR02145 family)